MKRSFLHIDFFQLQVVLFNFHHRWHFKEWPEACKQFFTNQAKVCLLSFLLAEKNWGFFCEFCVVYHKQCQAALLLSRATLICHPCPFIWLSLAYSTIPSFLFVGACFGGLLLVFMGLILPNKSIGISNWCQTYAIVTIPKHIDTGPNEHSSPIITLYINHPSSKIIYWCFLKV